ncbi:MAG: sigma-70 family RNA polymerase sigma factor [Bacteroidota bacterium]
MAQSIEEHIIQLLQQNDKKAMGLLYDHYAASLYGIILKVVQSETIAQDVLQDAFIKIWQNGDKYDRSKGKLFTWLLNIARNLAIDKTRSANFRQKRKIQSLDELVITQKGPSVENKPEHIGLGSVIAKLEEKYRIIIDLIYFQGYTQKEVEEHLGIPLGTVKSRVRIALRELRKTFEEHNVTLLLLVMQLLNEHSVLALDLITGIYG